MQFDLKNVLNNSFRLETFLPGQEEIIETILNHDHSIISVPAGAGKNVAYQLPSLILDGKTVIITKSRVINSQVNKLNRLNLKAAGISIERNSRENIKAISRIDLVLPRRLSK